MKYDGERRPEEIEAEIERTRANMDATLSAIERRLTPGELLDQGMDYLRHSGGNEFVANLGESVKHHPLPVTVVGLGLAWLMMADRWDRGPADRSGPSAHRGTEAAHAAGERLRGASQTAGDALHRTAEAATSAGHRVAESAHAARESFEHAAAAARERAGRIGETSRRQYERARGGYENLVREQPLALGAIGLALGALVAAALPHTRREDELMGEASDQLADQVRERGREGLGKAGQAASAAREAASDELRRQGMATPGSEPRREGTPGASRPEQATGVGVPDPLGGPGAEMQPLRTDRPPPAR